MAIRKIVDAALKAEFSIKQVKRALVLIQTHPQRRDRPPITKQTLWAHMGDPAPDPRDQRKQGTNEDWIDAVEAVHAEHDAAAQTR